MKEADSLPFFPPIDNGNVKKVEKVAKVETLKA